MARRVRCKFVRDQTQLSREGRCDSAQLVERVAGIPLTAAGALAGLFSVPPHPDLIGIPRACAAAVEAVQGTERLCTPPLILAAPDQFEIEGPIGPAEIPPIRPAGIARLDDPALVRAGNFDIFPFAFGHLRTVSQ